MVERYPPRGVMCCGGPHARRQATVDTCLSSSIPLSCIYVPHTYAYDLCAAQTTPPLLTGGTRGPDGEAPRPGGGPHGPNARHGHRGHRHGSAGPCDLNAGLVPDAQRPRDEGRGRASRKSPRQGVLDSSCARCAFPLIPRSRPLRNTPVSHNRTQLLQNVI